MRVFDTVVRSHRSTPPTCFFIQGFNHTSSLPIYFFIVVRLQSHRPTLLYKGVHKKQQKQECLPLEDKYALIAFFDALI